MITITEYFNDPNFHKFCKEELENCINNPRRISGRIANIDEIKKMVYIGKSAEWYLVNNTILEKLTLENLKIYKPEKFDIIKRYIKWNDLIDPRTGDIVEVKCWKSPWAKAEKSKGLDKLREDKQTWLMADYALIFQDNENGTIEYIKKVIL